MHVSPNRLMNPILAFQFMEEHCLHNYVILILNHSRVNMKDKKELRFTKIEE